MVRHAIGLMLVVPVLVACGANGTEDRAASSESCVGPYLDDQPPASRVFRGPRPTVSPGHSITIYGHWYAKSCNDTGGHDPLQPLPPVRLTLTLPGGHHQSLGRYTPGGPDMGFVATVLIPAANAYGTATISDDRDPRATFRITVGRT